MLLVHKQPMHHALSSIPLSHRRNPSAPSMVTVLPTRTPGLLSLSRPTPKDVPRQAVKPLAAPRQPRQPRHQRSAEDDRQLPADGPIVPPAPSRGKDKDRKRRSASQAPQAANNSSSDSESPAPTKASPRKRPQQPRTVTAPPPPQPTSPIAVAAAAPAPATIGQPSGRLARNRRARHKSSSSEVFTSRHAAGDVFSAAAATPTLGVPVPPRRKSTPPPLSRSAPLDLTHGLSDWDLPAALKRDTSPTLHQPISAGPRSAPFPSFSPPPSPTVHRPSHYRSPSFPTEAMFTMTLDDEPPRTPNRANPRAKSNSAIKRLLYAGSSFQNAPDAEDLPAPTFLATP